MLEAENVPAGPALLGDAEWQDVKLICDR